MAEPEINSPLMPGYDPLFAGGPDQPQPQMDVAALQQALALGGGASQPGAPQPPAPNLGTMPEGTAQQPAPVLSPAQTSQPGQGPAGPPRQTWKPNAFNLFSAVTGKGLGYQQMAPGQPARPVSRLDAFEQFVGNFLTSFSQGMANAGHGPGASGRGFAAAVQAPYQRDVGQYQLQQQAQEQQARIQLQQEQAEATRAQSQLVSTPWGMMPAKLAAAMMGQYYKGGAAADTAAESRENVANIKGKFDIQRANIMAGGKARTELQLIGDALKGDKQAEAQLNVLQQRRKDLIDERNQGLNQRPLFQLQKAIDPETGQVTFVTGNEIERAKAQGKNYIPSGPLSQKEVISVQQLQSEAAPAVKAVRDNISAFDNENDRAIFARILHGAGSPGRGEEAGWMGTIINQALQSDLSPQGQKEAQALGRLAETMGRLRSTLGLPATDQSMAVTMSLLPGRSTGSSKYAKGQVDQLEQMIQQAVSVPALRGAAGGGNAPAAKPGPLTAEEAQGYLARAGGNKDTARKLAKADGRSF